MTDTSDDAERFVILISHERSGSHYLTDMLASTSELRSFDEVCNFQAINPDTSPASFFRFRRDAQVGDPDIALRPSVETNTRLLDQYLRHLSELAPVKKRLLIDIKYGHIHNFEIFWWPTERRPFLLSYLEKRGIRIVHLTRRDSIASTVSGFVADKRRIWHKKAGDEDAPAAPIRVPAQRMVHEALALEREKENFFSWLGTNLSFDIEYEQLAGTDGVRNAAMARLCEFLGLPCDGPLQSQHQKVTPPLREALENYGDLAALARLFGNGRLRLE